MSAGSVEGLSSPRSSLKSRTMSLQLSPRLSSQLNSPPLSPKEEGGVKITNTMSMEDMIAKFRKQEVKQLPKRRRIKKKKPILSVAMKHILKEMEKDEQIKIKTEVEKQLV